MRSAATRETLRCGASGSRAWWTPIPATSLEASASASRWPSPSRAGALRRMSCPARCFWMSRPGAWTGLARRELADLTRGLADRGAAVVIATHDVQFAATFADRVVLLGRGDVVADGSAEEMLSGGWYFSTEVARILDGAAITVEHGAGVLREAGPDHPNGGAGSVTWELVALAVLGATLLGGFAWYERSRPPSQIVALVAALAAISVAGRVAFSPIPNVVPTTDITLVAGFALGGAPGFAVGALSGLVSNFWLGQGPWTPWQMAGWGMTGLIGAWLATVTGRHVGRFGLAAVPARSRASPTARSSTSR